MTPADFKAAQARLGISDRLFGEAIGWEGDPGRTVRRLKAGDNGIQGPVAHRVRQLLRAHDRAALPSRWIFGDGETGEPEYIVHLERPGFVAMIKDTWDGEIEVQDVHVVAWLDEPPAEMSDALALMREAATVLNAYTALNDV